MARYRFPEKSNQCVKGSYRVAAAYFKANNVTKLPSLKKLEAEYAQLASEKAKFYEQYKEAKEELLKLQTARQNDIVCGFWQGASYSGVHPVFCFAANHLDFFTRPWYLIVVR